MANKISELVPENTGEFVECQQENVKKDCQNGNNAQHIATFFYETNQGKCKISFWDLEHSSF